MVLPRPPDTPGPRLVDRGEPPGTAAETPESGALDVTPPGAGPKHGAENAAEVAATDRAPEAVADATRAAVEGEREPSAGTVDFIDYI